MERGMIQFKTPFGPVQAGHQSRKGHKLWDAPKGRGNPYGTRSKVVQLSRRRQPSGDTDKSISKRKHHRVLLGLAAVFLIMGITVMSLNIRQITVSGNSRYTKEELIERIFPGKADWNVLYCYGKDRLREHMQIPFVEDYNLVFHSPFDVEVIVHEKSVVGYVSYMSSYMYFDKDGIIVESTNEEVEGIPRIMGLSYGQIVLHKSLPVKDQKVFREILDLTQVLTRHELGVERIQFDSRGDATLHMENLEVFLGDSSNIAGKVLRLSNMLPELEGLNGILYLDTYDPTNSNMAFTFKRKS